MALVRAVVFDVDGPLLDSHDARAHAWLDVLRGHGKDLPYERVRHTLGRGGDAALAELVGIAGDAPEAPNLAALQGTVFRAHYLADVGPTRGARHLVERLRSRGFACGAVSARGGIELAELLRAAAVADLIEHRAAAEIVPRETEADRVLRLLERMAVGPREAILIGDTPHALAVAASAGIPAIALRSGGWAARDLGGALAVYGSPVELAANLEGSPLSSGYFGAPKLPVRRDSSARRGSFPSTPAVGAVGAEAEDETAPETSSVGDATVSGSDPGRAAGRWL